jgi:hypothetical protein
MPHPSPEVHAGQAIYTRRVLRLYDLLVLGLSNRFVWRCPTRELLAWYDAHVTANHLDVGVGTGYFLDRCRFPSAPPRLALMDLNSNCLEAASRRVARYAPSTFLHDVLEPVPTDALLPGAALGGGPFGSIGMNYLLHCLPGPYPRKAAAFDHLQALLAPGGVIFGSTILAEGVPRGFAARRLMAAYNRRGVFSNATDSLGELRATLTERFSDVAINTIGCVALFRAGV